MTALERRVQMLIDRDRYRLLENESQRTGQSVAAVIRDAIDRLLESVPSVRAAAASSLLAYTNPSPEEAVEWSDVKSQLESNLVAKHS